MNLKYSTVIPIGFGPYFFSKHLPVLANLKIQIPFVVETNSQFQRTSDYLLLHGYKSTQIILIPDSIKTFMELTPNIKKQMQELFSKFSSSETLVMICTEPRGHAMWLEFLMHSEFSIFLEKPIIAIENATKNEVISEQIFQYCVNLNSRQKHRKNSEIYIGLDRPISNVGKTIFQWINEGALRGEHLNQLQISYSFGGRYNFEEYSTKENHPLKYGYGMIYHSGLHLIDMHFRFLKAGLIAKANVPVRLNIIANTVLPAPHLGETDFNAIFTAEAVDQPARRVSGLVHLTSRGFSRRENFDTPILNPYIDLKKVRSERYELHMGQNDKLVYTGHRSADSIQSNREEIEIHSSYSGRNLDFQKIDFLEVNQKSLLEKVLNRDPDVITLKDTLPSLKLFKAYSVAAAKAGEKIEMILD